MSNNNDTWIDEFYKLNPDAAPVEVEKKKKKASTLSLNDELHAMDFGKKSFYRDLSDEHKKEIGLWVLMRFMSSSQGAAEHHLTMVNDLVNHNYNNLSKHPELQWLLLSLCGTGRKQYHPWIAPPKGVKKNKVEEAISTHYPLLRYDEIELLLKLNTTDELKQFFKDNGWQDKAIDELFKSDKKGK